MIQEIIEKYQAKRIGRLISMGGDVCGECGVLDRTIDDAHLIISTSAVRDEGTSYRYLPVSDEV